MRWGVFDAATGAWLRGPFEDGEPQAGKGEELVLDVPISALLGLSRWDQDKRGFLDVARPTALERLLDVLALGRLPDAAEIAAIRAAQTKT